MTVRFAYRIYVRDASMVEVGPLNDDNEAPYRSFDADLRLMAAGGTVGTFTVVAPSTAPGLGLLFTGGGVIPRMGLVVRVPGTDRVLCSGDLVSGEIDDSPGGYATLICEPDDGILADDLAFPNPAVDVPTTGTAGSSAQDVRTGPGETVLKEYVAANIGPAASLTRRRYPWLDIPATTSLGTSQTWKARDETLLDVANRIASGAGIAWTLRQASEGGAVRLHVWTPQTIPGITFSPSKGTVTGLKINAQAGTVDEVIVAAGEDDDRVRTRRSNAVPTGQRRRVKWVSSSARPDDFDALTVMRQDADKTLADGLPTAGAVFDVADDAAERFGVTWRLGDLTPAASWQRAIVLVPVTSAHIEHTPGMPTPRVTASIGGADPDLPVIPAADVRRVLDAYLRSR